MPMSHYLRCLRSKIGHDLLAMAAAGICIFDQDGRLLLAKDAETDFWMLPGGAIDPDEIPADAAIRECYEETGLLVEISRLIGVFGGPAFQVNYPNGDVAYYTTIAFEGRVVGGSPRPDGLEVESLRYFTKAEFESALVAPPSRIIATQAFRSECGGYFAPPTWTPD